MLIITQGEKEMIIPRSNTRFNSEVAKPPLFDREASKVVESIIAYRLYIKIEIMNVAIKEQMLL